MICSNISSVSVSGSDQVKTCADQRPDLIACWIRSLLAFSQGVSQKPYHADSTATALTFRRFRVGDGNVEEERGWEREGWKEGLGGDLEETGEQEEAHVASESALSPSAMTSPVHGHRVSTLFTLMMTSCQSRGELKLMGALWLMLTQDV